MKLNADEELICTMRHHPIQVAGRVLVLSIVAAATGVGIALIPMTARPLGQYLVAALGAIMTIAFGVIPLARWALTTYTLTTRRLVMRWGIVRRHVEDLPLAHIERVAYSRGPLQWLTGAGNLMLTTVVGRTLSIHNLAQIRALSQAIEELVGEQLRYRPWSDGLGSDALGFDRQGNDSAS